MENDKLEEEFILKLETEITNLNNAIKKYDSNYEKKRKLSLLKIELIKAKMIAPFILAGSIVLGGFKYFGFGYPFILDDINKNKEIKKTFDSNNNTRYETTYAFLPDNKNTISYYRKNDDNTWNISQYNLNKFTEKQVLNLFEKENVNFEEIFGKAIANYLVEDNRLNNIDKDFMEATIYNIEENAYYVVRENIEENVAITLLYLLSTAFTELFTFIYYDNTKYKNLKEISELRENCIYNPEMLKIMRKKLEIKEKNYKYITRQI